MTTKMISRQRALMVATCLGLTFATTQVHSMGSDSSTNSAKLTDYAKAVELINEADYEDAIPLLEKSIREKGEYADALNQLGFAYRKSGKWNAGMQYYLKALELEPNHLGANEYLGELYLEQKDLPNAETQLAKLKAACGSCDEYKALADAIDEYTKDNGID